MQGFHQLNHLTGPAVIFQYSKNRVECSGTFPSSRQSGSMVDTCSPKSSGDGSSEPRQHKKTLSQNQMQNDFKVSH